MKRRALLGTVGAASVFGTAGCLDSIDPRDTDLTLGHYWLTNYTNETVELDARVERDGGTVHEGSYEVKPRDDESRTLGATGVECTWGDEAGEYTLYARRQGRDWVSIELAEGDDGFRQTTDCAIGEATYRGQTIEFWLRDHCEELLDSRGCSFAQERFAR